MHETNALHIQKERYRKAAAHMIETISNALEMQDVRKCLVRILLEHTNGPSGDKYIRLKSNYEVTTAIAHTDIGTEAQRHKIISVLMSVNPASIDAMFWFVENYINTGRTDIHNLFDLPVDAQTSISDKPVYVKKIDSNPFNEYQVFVYAQTDEESRIHGAPRFDVTADGQVFINDCPAVGLIEDGYINECRMFMRAAQKALELAEPIKQQRDKVYAQQYSVDNPTEEQIKQMGYFKYSQDEKANE